jgi:hypothetical protein
MEKNRYKNLVLEINKCKPITILDIGTHDGKHAKHMIQAAAKFQPAVIYYGFDLWEQIQPEQKRHESSETSGKKTASMQTAIDILSETGTEFYLIQGNTRQTLSVFEPKLPIDFVFIDGGHSLETVRSDWNNIKRLMHRGTIVLFDDYYTNNRAHGCFETIHQIMLDSDYNVELLGPIDYKKDLYIQFAKVSLR